MYNKEIFPLSKNESLSSPYFIEIGKQGMFQNRYTFINIISKEK